MRQDPSVNTNSAAIFKSPDWTLSIHTPELSSMLDLGGASENASASAFFPGFDGPASAGSTAQRALERNPFSESFTSAVTVGGRDAGGRGGRDAHAVPVGIPIMPAAGDDEDRLGSRSDEDESSADTSVPGLVEVAAAAVAKAGSKKPVGKRGRTRNPSEPSDDPAEEKRRRRRERNRVAAATCRQRKIDRESTLREELKDLHASHGQLFDSMVALQRELVLLKQEAVKHMESGCTGFEA
jgi:hypothetical protein